ncbi:unnamed protein product, partial [marine sediment metagenome]
MRSFLVQPYPFNENATRKLAVCACVGLFITLFLAVFEPFGFDNLESSSKWVHAGAFGAVTFALSSFFQIILPQLFPALFKEEAWRSWKEILYLLITALFIGGGNYALMLWLYPQNTELAGLLRAEIITFQIGVFPIVAIVFMKQMMLYRRFEADAKEATEELETEEKEFVVQPKQIAERILLRGDNQKEALVIKAEDLLFISSADNYVALKFLEAGQHKSMLVRSSLKKMEEQLAAHLQFIRCHKGEFQ